MSRSKRQTEQARKWRQANPTYQRDRARENKLRLIAFFGGHCQDCGATGHPAIFDFDHIDPKTKAFPLASRMGNRSWDDILKEAKKCRMLCANCHRVRTWTY